MRALLIFLALALIGPMFSLAQNTPPSPAAADDDENNTIPHSQSSSIDKDLIFCIENGKCGLSNICSFALGDGLSEGRCFGNGCFNMTGHIMRIENDMDYSINFKWDVLGDDTYHNVEVPKHSAKYINTDHSSSHSVRLYIGDEPVDTTVASFDQCTPNEACEYLLRVCYGPESVDPKCAEYARHCHGFAKENSDAKETCIPDCIMTYYSEDIKVDPTQIDPELVVDFFYNGGGVIGSATITTMMETVPTAATVTIIVLAIYAVIITIALAVVSWKWWYSSRYNYVDLNGGGSPNGGPPGRGYSDDHGFMTGNNSNNGGDGSFTAPNNNSGPFSYTNGPPGGGGRLSRTRLH